MAARRASMSAAPALSAGPEAGAGFRHDALLYTGDEEFVEAVAAFVQDGLARDEPTLIAVIESRASLLRGELGRDADAVEFLDMGRLGRNPARIIPAWQDWVNRNRLSGRGFRGVSEAIWAERTPAELAECQKHEQLLDLAFAGGPDWCLLCPYDTGSLPAHVIEWAYDTHPDILHAEPAWTGNNIGHPRPELVRATVLAARLPEPDPADLLYRASFGLRELPALRPEIARYAQDFGFDEQRAQDLVLVANELFTNSIRHGGGRGALKLWRAPTGIICEVHDRGLVTDPLVGRRRPAPSAGIGAGLWIANQLCDLVQIRSTPETGTIVRALLSEADD